ncbi:MAG: sulfotransferase domain-containing protein [Bacteroidia bacterium]
MLPNFLIIGAPRAGTTWIQKNLIQHPEVFMPSKKEIHFFDRFYEEGIGYYENFFEGASGFKAVGEATPAYLHREPVAQRIYDHLGPIKMIVTLRNPVDRLYSRYWNSRGKFIENKGLSFEEKVMAKPEFIEEGFYAEHLSRYYDIFPKENLLVMFFDDIKKDSAGFLSQIFEFIGVDPSFDPSLADQRVNTSDSKKLLVKSKPLYYLSKASRKVNLGSLATRLEDMNRATLPPMTKETRKWLIDNYYGNKNEMLGNLVGRDLSVWNKV